MNQSAKRYRDSASSYYHSRKHGFAGCAKETKNELYRLKDIGIRYLYSKGLLEAIGIHDKFCVYKGNIDGQNYCFHSRYVPNTKVFTDEQLNDETLFIEKKDKLSNHMRLCDAKETLLVISDINCDMTEITEKYIKEIKKTNR